MLYLIDGYNLLFRKIRAGEDLSLQRQHLIHEIYQKSAAVGLMVTIVFDAHYQPEEESRSHFKSLEIRFSGHGETADQLILKEVKRSTQPSHITVVTSDKKLALHARSRLAKTETIEEFMESLNRRYRKKQANKSPPLSLLPLVSKEERNFSPPEGTDDYYLDIFQKRLEETPQKKKIKTPKRTSKKKREEPLAEPKLPEEDEMARWLRLFSSS